MQKPMPPTSGNWRENVPGFHGRLFPIWRRNRKAADVGSHHRGYSCATRRAQGALNQFTLEHMRAKSFNVKVVHVRQVAFGEDVQLLDELVGIRMCEAFEGPVFSRS